MIDLCVYVAQHNVQCFVALCVIHVLRGAGGRHYSEQSSQKGSEHSEHF